MGEKKRITIMTYGSRGDVEPFVALGVRLRNAGYAVRLAAPAPFSHLVEGRGLELAPIAGDPDELAQAFADRAGLSWPRMVVRMIQHVLPLAEAAVHVLDKAAQDADLIVHSFMMTEAGHTLARRGGIPDVSAQFFPVFLPTSAFPSVAVPDLPLGGAYRRATHLLNTAIFRYGGRLLYRRLRLSSPGLPELAPWPFQSQNGSRPPVLLAYSRHILPPPPDWPAWAHVTGYWQLPPPPGWTPPEAALRFLESGTPPVYFGPGSMRTERLRPLLEAVIAAARRCGQRSFLGVPPGSLAGELRGEDVFAMDGLPHAWLFPRMGYILHHAGAGTTGAASAAGVPNSGIPFSADQAFWARRLQRLGLGPEAPPARELTRERLEPVLAEALFNPAYRRTAEQVGQAIRQEDGIGSALQVIRRLVLHW